MVYVPNSYGKEFQMHRTAFYRPAADDMYELCVDTDEGMKTIPISYIQIARLTEDGVREMTSRSYQELTQPKQVPMKEPVWDEEKIEDVGRVSGVSGESGE